MIYLVFLGGVIFGTLITRFLTDRVNGKGYFKLEPFDDDDTGCYKVNVRLKANQDLLKVKRIILNKEDLSQK